MGKGSHRRQEDIKKVWDNWDTIFGKKDKPDEKRQEIKEEKPNSNAPKDNAK